MTMLDSAPIYPSHFKIHENLSPEADAAAERADWNVNIPPGNDIIEWLEPACEAIKDDPSVYNPDPNNFHFTILRLGLFDNIPSENIANFAEALKAEFQDYEVPEFTLKAPKVVTESITAEFDEESQVELMRIRKRVLQIAETALGDLFEKPDWYLRGENGPRIHVTLAYLQEHTDEDKDRLRAKLESAGLDKLVTRILWLAVLKQISMPQKGHYKQDEVAAKIELSQV